ncbi:MAG: enoyl-CoA hydratase/isomerase family protein [Parachlamydiaceae bacterium]|nr:enoyl-CoA hydratase/isomerase family protein [Parachlamydiaceae bacterium]
MKHLTYDHSDQIATITINRPNVLNALNHDLLEELLHFIQVIAPQDQIKAVILTGAGKKAFIAGADIKEMQVLSHPQLLQFCEMGQRVANALETAPFLTLAAINGYALGGGLEMALACDFAYASSTAQLGLPEITLGLIPSFGGTVRLANAVGMRQAKELIFSGKLFSAATAEKLGIINQVCEPDRLLQECLDSVKEIIKHSYAALIHAKSAINNGEHLSLAGALELERHLFSICFASQESKDAICAFIAKHKVSGVSS